MRHVLCASKYQNVAEWIAAYLNKDFQVNCEVRQLAPDRVFTVELEINDDGMGKMINYVAIALNSGVKKGMEISTVAG